MSWNQYLTRPQLSWIEHLPFKQPQIQSKSLLRLRLRVPAVLDLLQICSKKYLLEGPNLGKSAENGVSTTYEALSGALSSI